MIEPEQAAPGAAPCRSRSRISAGRTAALDTADRLWRAEFLAALAETSNVGAASAAAGVPPAHPYKVRAEDPEFARLWRAALLEGYEHLEMDVLHRLRFGEPKDAEVKFDNASALRLLGLHRETVLRERAMRESEDLGPVRAAIDAKLEQLRQKVIARRPAVLADAASCHG
jgi:hypothetical protein